MTVEIVADVQHRRLERLARICNELNGRLLYARARAAYALEMRNFDGYLSRLEQYKQIEAQLVIYRYLIGQEWVRVMGVRQATLPPARNVTAWL